MGFPLDKIIEIFNPIIDFFKSIAKVLGFTIGETTKATTTLAAKGITGTTTIAASGITTAADDLEKIMGAGAISGSSNNLVQQINQPTNPQTQNVQPDENDTSNIQQSKANGKSVV